MLDLAVARNLSLAEVEVDAEMTDDGGEDDKDDGGEDDKDEEMDDDDGDKGENGEWATYQSLVSGLPDLD